MRKEREIYTIIRDDGHPYTYSGFKYSRFRKPTRDDTALISDLDAEKMEEVLELLRSWFEPSNKATLRHTSYGIKHWVEDSIREYISNNQLKDAMLILGFEPSNWYELNWCFKVKPTNKLKEFLKKRGDRW